MNEKCCLPYQQIKDAAAIKPLQPPLRELRMATNPQTLQPALKVHPEGTQDGKEQDTGPRQLRCTSKE